MKFKICSQASGELLFGLFIINQTPDEVIHFIIQKEGARSIFHDTKHRYIKNNFFIFFITLNIFLQNTQLRSLNN